MIAALFSLGLMAAQVEVLNADSVRADGTIYRLYHVDAPQTGIAAKCQREIERSLDTAAFIRERMAGAERIQIIPGYDPPSRRSWPHDRRGRRLAYVIIDGHDLGELLIAEGRAVRWKRREEYNWCALR